MDGQAGQRSWAELIPEILISIFSHLGFHSLIAVSGVCRSWYAATLDPECWESIHLSLHASFLDTFIKETIPIEDSNRLNMKALCIMKRSRMRARSICISWVSNKEIIKMIAERCPLIESLSVRNCQGILEGVLCNLIQSCEQLKLFDASFSGIVSTAVIEEIGHRGTGLVGLNLSRSKVTDEMAVIIGKFNPRLKWINLTGTTISNSGLYSILDLCHELEYLNIKQCQQITMNHELKNKCCRVKEFNYRLHFSSVEEEVGYHHGYDFWYP